MNLLHKGMEMHAALGRNAKCFVEQIHQHRLTAPHAAPHIYAARSLRLAADEPREEACFSRFLQSHLQLRQMLHCAALIRICLQFARCNQRFIAGRDPAHFDGGRAVNLRTIPENAATV